MGVGAEAYWPTDTTTELDLRPIGDVIAGWARRTPSAPAVLWRESSELQSLSYLELHERAEAISRRLTATVGRDRTVGACAATSADWLALEYGAALAGIPLVPVNPAFTDAEIEQIVRTADVGLLLADATFRSSPLLERLRALAPVARVDLVHPLSMWRDLSPSDGPLPTVNPGAPFLIQFTSGTTGRSKGAVLSHRAAFNCARLSMQRLGGTQHDVWLNPLPMHHVGGSVSVALAVLSVGAAIVLVPAFEPGAVLELLEDAGATIVGSVPTMLLALLEHERFASTDLSALRFVQSGGSTVPPSLIRRVEKSFGAGVIVGYGQSESPNAIQTDAGDDDVTKAQTIGRPLPQREVRIADPEGRTVAVGTVGELLMRSPLVMDGYIGVDSDTAARTLDAEAWLHTGDLCSMDNRGVISIHGRVRDMIIRGGENIYPAEVEDVLLQHPAIADVAVVGVADDRWGEVPVACYRPAPNVDAGPDELERHARERLASFKVPRRWVPFEQFPLTASGKVKKFELRRALEAST